MQDFVHDASTSVILAPLVVNLELDPANSDAVGMSNCMDEKNQLSNDTLSIYTVVFLVTSLGMRFSQTFLATALPPTKDKKSNTVDGNLIDMMPFGLWRKSPLVIGVDIRIWRSCP